MPWGILGWIIIGGLAGWLASIIMKRNDQMGILANIAVGIVGAIIGGWLISLFGFDGGDGLIPSLLTALLGAVVLLALIGMFTGRKR